MLPRRRAVPPRLQSLGGDRRRRRRTEIPERSRLRATSLTNVGDRTANGLVDRIVWRQHSRLGRFRVGRIEVAVQKQRDGEVRAGVGGAACQGHLPVSQLERVLRPSEQETGLLVFHDGGELVRGDRVGASEEFGRAQEAPGQPVAHAERPHGCPVGRIESDDVLEERQPSIEALGLESQVARWPR